MKSYIYKLLLIGIFLNGNLGSAQKLSDTATPLIVAKKQDKEVILEKIFIEDGETEVITDSSIITIILPVGIGTAGSVVKAPELGNMIIVDAPITYHVKCSKP